VTDVVDDAQQQPTVWVDGRVLDDPREPAIQVADHGFTVGDGVFEAVKVVDGVPFALTRHLRRLGRSAAGLGLPPVDEADVRRGVAEVLGRRHLPHGRLRITYTAGPAPMGSGRSGDGSTTLVVAAVAGPQKTGPASVVTVPWPRNERGAIAGLKTTSYAENVVALAYAAERGAEEAVFGNLAGHLCEGTGTNVFYVVDGELRTPPLSSGCLAGITRELLVEWCGAREVAEPLEVLRTADEVFLASTTRDVQPVARCDDRTWDGPGPVTQSAARTWREREAEHPDP
jgi:branched-chain amino acid aminotransferase